MLTTTAVRNFQLGISDGTYSFLPGTARIGNTLMAWNGTTGLLNLIPTFSGVSDASKYQNCLLYLYDSNGYGAVDMTVSRSATATAIQDVSLPVMVDSTGYPLSMFTFFSTTGSDSTLAQYTHL